MPDVKQLTDHYLRQQCGGSIAGFCGARMQRGYGIGGIFKSLARFAMPLFKKSAKAVGKRALQAATEIGQDVLEGESITKSAKSRGKQAVGDLGKAAVNKAMTGRGRRKGTKRAATTKTAICPQTKKLKTSNKLDNHKPKWNGSYT